MTTPSDQAPQDLTPETRAILKRARRSFLFSIGLLLLGFIAIGGALVYRATRDAPAQTTAATGTFTAEALRLPQGAEVISVVATGGTVTVTYRIGPATQVRLFDETGAMTRQFDIVLE